LLGRYNQEALRLSIIIVNWNTCDFLIACVASILGSKTDFPYEIIVIDNNSTDESAEKVKKLFPNVILRAENHNHGYARGNNLGFQIATGDYILTLNPDTILPPLTLFNAVESLSSKPDFGMLSVKLIGTDGNVQHSVRGFPTFPGILGEILKVKAWNTYTLESFDYAKSQPAPQPMGTFLLFKRSALKDIGDDKNPFDEQFPIFFNEVDLLKRLDKKGFKCWYDADISITHYGGESTKQVKKGMIWESHLSLIRYFNKHISGATRLLLPLVSFAIYIGAFVRARGFHAGFRP
jgi:GT2 family glycosyltransferase